MEPGGREGGHYLEKNVQQYKHSLINLWYKLNAMKIKKMFLKFWTDCGVAVLDAESAGVVMGTLIQEFHPVLLGGEWGGKMDGDHL